VQGHSRTRAHSCCQLWLSLKKVTGESVIERLQNILPALRERYLRRGSRSLRRQKEISCVPSYCTCTCTCTAVHVQCTAVHRIVQHSCIRVRRYSIFVLSYSCKLLTLHSKRTLTTYLRIFIFIVHVRVRVQVSYVYFGSTKVLSYSSTKVQRTFESTNRTKVRVQLLYVVRVHVYYVHFRKYSYFRTCTRTCRPYVVRTVFYESTKVRKYFTFEDRIFSKVWKYFRK
jgi:hypothetical protein